MLKTSTPRSRTSEGGGGFTTNLLAPTRIMANMVARIYNWWTLYGRMFNGEHHQEAVA